MDFYEGLVDLDGLGVDMASKTDTWVSNKVVIPLNSVATSPATEVNIQQDFKLVKILLYIYLSYRS